MTCILTQRHMWSPLSIIALPGGDSRDLFSRHWHNIDMYLTPNIGVICREIFTKCPWLQTLSFFLSVCQLTPIFVCTVQLYHRWIMKLKSGGKHSIYHPATRNQSFHDFHEVWKKQDLLCQVALLFLYTHNWKALSLYIYCIKPSCPYLEKKRTTGNLPSHKI